MYVKYYFNLPKIRVDPYNKKLICLRLSRCWRTQLLHDVSLSVFKFACLNNDNERNIDNSNDLTWCLNCLKDLYSEPPFFNVMHIFKNEFIGGWKKFLYKWMGGYLEGMNWPQIYCFLTYDWNHNLKAWKFSSFSFFMNYITFHFSFLTGFFCCLHSE